MQEEEEEEGGERYPYGTTSTSTTTTTIKKASLASNHLELQDQQEKVCIAVGTKSAGENPPQGLIAQRCYHMSSWTWGQYNSAVGCS
jgi:hypothetical protein